MHYAHRTQDSNPRDWQPLKDHLRQVGQYSETFSSQFNAAPWGKLAGLLHDAGKFSKAFQERLAGKPIPVDHATAGAQFIYRKWAKGDKPNPLSHILAAIIAGHHAGLAISHRFPEERMLARRLRKEIHPYETELERSLEELDLTPLMPPLQPGFHAGLQFSLFTRMLFLVSSMPIHWTRRTMMIPRNFGFGGPMFHFPNCTLALKRI